MRLCAWKLTYAQTDARFPVLPRWFTDPIHTHVFKYAREHEDISALEFLLSDQNKSRSHAYAVLEELFYLVLEHRWINHNPTCTYTRYTLVHGQSH